MSKAISLHTLPKGRQGISRSVVFWYCLISIRARVPGRYRRLAFSAVPFLLLGVFLAGEGPASLLGSLAAVVGRFAGDRERAAAEARGTLWPTVGRLLAGDGGELNDRVFGESGLLVAACWGCRPPPVPGLNGFPLLAVPVDLWEAFCGSTGPELSE